jgi:tetratricopeptide (TPR) repeat protein
MAIKIKKKSNQEDESPEVAETAEATAAPDLSTADAFERRSIEVATWIEDNRSVVIGGFFAIIALAAAGYFGVQYLEAQNVKLSAEMNPVFGAYAQPVEGTSEFEAFNKNWEGEKPEAFEDEQAKWQAIYDNASQALEGGADSSIALPAKMAKAGAAVELGKAEEAVKIYEDVLDSTKDDGLRAGAYLGLAGARTATGDVDGAIKAYDELAKVDETIAESLRYRKARLLERKGDVEAAKALYHEILDDNPTSPNKTDIERRLATL